MLNDTGTGWSAYGPTSWRACLGCAASEHNAMAFVFAARISGLRVGLGRCCVGVASRDKGGSEYVGWIVTCWRDIAGINAIITRQKDVKGCRMEVTVLDL